MLAGALLLFAAGAGWAAGVLPDDASLAAPTPGSENSAVRNVNKANKARWNVQANVLMVAMPQEKLLPLLPDLRDPHKVDAAVEQLLAAVQRKEAILTGYPSLVTLDGFEGNGDAGAEIIYPTEFEPPLTPQTVGAAGATAPGAAPSATPAPSTGNLELPTAFESRNISTWMRVKSHVSAQGDSIHLDLAASRCELLDFDRYEAIKTTIAHERGSNEPDNRRSKIVKADQPRFYTSKVNTQIVLRNGQRALVGVYLLSKPEGYMEVFVVQAAATPLR